MPDFQRLKASRLIPRVILVPMLVLAFWARDVRAELIIEATDILATPGSSGTFDITLVYEGTTGPSIDVVGFTAEVGVAPLSGVTFTGASDGTSLDYIFLNLATLGFGTVLSPDSSTIDAFDTTDITQTPIPVRTLNPGDRFGLARISYNVSATTPGGTFDLVIDPNLSVVNALGNGTFPNVLGGVKNGTITVPTAVPEPSTLFGGLLGATLIGVAAFLRRESFTRPIETSA